MTYSEYFFPLKIIHAPHVNMWWIGASQQGKKETLCSLSSNAVWLYYLYNCTHKNREFQDVSTFQCQEFRWINIWFNDQDTETTHLMI